MKRGRIIDAEFVMVDQADQPSQARKKPTFGQLWYVFCYALLLLAFLSVAIPLLFGLLAVVFAFLKSII